MDPQSWSDNHWLMVGAAVAALVLGTGAVSVVCCGPSLRAWRQTVVSALAWLALVVFNEGAIPQAIGDPIVQERLRSTGFFLTLASVTLYALGPVRERWFPREQSVGSAGRWQVALELGLIVLLLAPLLRHLTDVHPRPIDFLPLGIGALLAMRSLVQQRRTPFRLPQLAVAAAASALELLLPVLHGTSDTVTPALVAAGGLIGAFLFPGAAAAAATAVWLLLVALSATLDPQIVSPVSRTLCLVGVGCIFYGLLITRLARRAA